MIGWLVRMLVTAIGITLRYRIEDPHGLLVNTPDAPMIFAFWHNRIFLMPYLFKRYWRPRGHGRVAVLISASKDGEKLARVLRHFNLVCVRGSTSRRGRQALRELTRLVEEGFDAGITPDGPRGPKYHLQPGIIDLAQLTQAPIIPVSYDLSHKITFNSWDAFMVPVPFTRCIARVGATVRVARDADEHLREQHRQNVEQTLRELSDK